MKKVLFFLIYTVILFVSADILFGSWYLKKTNQQLWKADLEREYNSRNRILYPAYDHGFIPNTTVQYEWGHNYYQIYINSLGFLDKEIRNVPLETDKYRVLFIGDSFVEGLGYPYQETFVGKIEQTLGTSHYELLNAGVTSYAPKLYFNKTKYLLEQINLKINEIVIFIDPSDPYDEIYYYKYFNPSNKPAEYLKECPSYSLSETIYGFFVDHSLLIHSLFPYSQKDDTRNVAPYVHNRGNWTFDEEYFNAYGREGLELCEKYMDQLVSLLKNQGIEKITIVVYPYPKQIENGDIDSKQVSFWKEFSEQHNVAFINLFPTFFELPNTDEYFIKNDVHWTAKGHELVAKTIIKDLGYDNNIEQASDSGDLTDPSSQINELGQ